VETGFWERRWADGQIAFHKDAVNEGLLRHAQRAFPPSGRVLVPLCGKSLDLGWLVDQGYEVHGIELVEQAVAAFFEARCVEPEIVEEAWGRAYRSDRITIHLANLFDVDLLALGPFQGIWDRAALIALPPRDRLGYLARLRQLVEAGATHLLESLAYESETMTGPPFSVPDAEIEAAYAGLSLTQLERENLIGTDRWRDRPATSAWSTLWVIRA
jgi:thiopurine S-methyltransferase